MPPLFPEASIAVQQFFGPNWLGIFRVLSILGDIQMVIVGVLLVLWLRGHRPAYLMLSAVIAGLLICALGWAVLDVPRPRPEQGIIVHEHVKSASFPSGHTTTATIAWTSLVALGWIPGAIAAAAIFLGALSRLYLGAHWITDLLVGLLVGLAVFWLSRRLAPRVAPWLSDHARPIVLAGGAIGLAGGIATFFSAAPAHWAIPGGMIGLAVGLPLEYLRIGYDPAKSRWDARARAIVGLTGLGVLLIAGRLTGEALPWLSALLAGLAALWGTVAAPWWFLRRPAPGLTSLEGSHLAAPSSRG